MAGRRRQYGRTVIPDTASSADAARRENVLSIPASARYNENAVRLPARSGRVPDLWVPSSANRRRTARFAPATGPSDTCVFAYLRHLRISPTSSARRIKPAQNRRQPLCMTTPSDDAARALRTENEPAIGRVRVSCDQRQ
jgi:hypothetical protein